MSANQRIQPFLGRRGAGGSYIYPLDVTTNAVSAIALRKLRSAYSGSCIRVRRSSDNAEQDIGFSGNLLNAASLLSFVGAGDGFLRTWYSQETTGNDYFQTTTSAQPQIVSSGSLVLDDNGKPTVFFNGTSHWMQGVHQDIINVLQGSSIFVVGKGDPAIDRFFFTEGNSASNNAIVTMYISGTTSKTVLDKSQWVRNNSNASYMIRTDLITTDPTTPDYDIFYSGLDLSGTSVRAAGVNGLEGSASPASFTPNGVVTTNRHSIGALLRASAASYFKINLQELIWYSDYKRSDFVSISSDLNSYYEHY